MILVTILARAVDALAFILRRFGADAVLTPQRWWNSDAVPWWSFTRLEDGAVLTFGPCELVVSRWRRWRPARA